MDKAPVSVRHQDGWCLTFRKSTKHSDSVMTACGRFITFPWGFKKIYPDCPECSRILRTRNEGEGSNL